VAAPVLAALIIVGIIVGTVRLGILGAGPALLPTTPRPTGVQTAGTPYRATVPGQPCDHGGATWVNDTDAHATCSDGWLALTGTKKGQTFAQELFYPPSGGPSLTRYLINVAVSQLAAGSCAGLQYQLSDVTPHHYSVAVCQDGSVAIVLLDTSGTHATLLSPYGEHVAPASIYHVSLAFTAGVQAVTINGQALPLITNRVAGTCDFISLATSNNSALGVHAAFADFVFARL
jgi:hypothetical protein